MWGMRRRAKGYIVKPPAEHALIGQVNAVLAPRENSRLAGRARRAEFGSSVTPSSYPDKTRVRPYTPRAPEEGDGTTPTPRGKARQLAGQAKVRVRASLVPRMRASSGAALPYIRQS